MKGVLEFMGRVMEVYTRRLLGISIHRFVGAAFTLDATMVFYKRSVFRLMYL